MNLNLFDMDGMMYADMEQPFMELAKPSENKYTGELSAFPSSTPLAMAYVPFQQWGNTKSPEDALENGTLFSDLVFPFREVGK